VKVVRFFRVSIYSSTNATSRLLFDQPEENFDNRTIATMLVPSSAKRRTKIRILWFLISY